MAEQLSGAPSPSPKMARVRLISQPLWRIRLTRELPRLLFSALAVAGLLASARFALDPPLPSSQRTSPRSFTADLAARGFASLFARRYLTWNAADPEAHRIALEAFVGGGIEPDAGMQVPASGEQTVEWAEVVQEREPDRDQHVFTVAAQTNTRGVLYLTVTVIRRSDGSLALGGYPAFVGSPASEPAGDTPATEAHEVGEAELATVVRRALSNYLAGSPAELDADLQSGAHVSLPRIGLTLESVQRLIWATGQDAVLAVVQARDERGGQYELAYELDVAREAGRWEISAIQVSPDA